MKNNLLVDAEAPPEEKYADWRVFSRSVVFFQLLSGLNSKLKHIFVPLMGLVWQGAADHLGTLIDFVKVMKPNMLSDTSSSKKGKKRKLLELEMSNNAVKASVDAVVSTDSSGLMQQRVLKELVAGCGWILKSVRKCCVNDNVNFVDQFQYESIIKQMSTLYAMREAFSSDDEYLTYAGDLVLPCIVQLVIAVGRDLLWKPLNHDVLVMMRSSQKSVKMAGLRGLQKLFTDVGEEYLILLPECLPFLSEVLEDSDSGVVALASEVIQSIEDLSGESLDSYLR
jgi:U3 small nucleolar RNA-associated protein 10